MQSLEKNYLAGGSPCPRRALKFGFILLLCGIFAGTATICRSANIIEFALPTGGAQPETIVFGADNFYWMAGFLTDQIIRINPTNGPGAKVYPTPTSPSHPFGLVSIGTNLWFTENFANKIGLFYTNVTVGGSNHIFKEFPIHATNNSTIPCGPAGLTVGPDTNLLWFVEAQTNKIGSFNLTTHAITEYFVPFVQNNRLYYNIVAGPDGNLWFTDTGAGRICAFSTNSSGANGTVAVFQLATNSEPFAIVVGPDNAIWFTEVNSSKIGRLTTDCFNPASFTSDLTVSTNINTSALTEFIVPTNNNNSVSITNAEPYGITVVTNGANINIWFVERAGSAIDRIDATGTTNGTNFMSLSRFPTPTINARPAFLTSGGDTNIWFGETAFNAVGKLVLDHSLNLTFTNPISIFSTNFSGILAAFTDDPTNGFSTNYSVVVNWGDGSTSLFTTNSSPTNAALHVSTNRIGGGFFVNGSHSYPGDGTFTVNLTVSNVGTNRSTGGATAAATFSIIIGPPVLTLTVTNIPWIGTNFSGILATFTDQPTNDSPASYVALVNWGDGASSALSISTNKIGGGFYLNGSHSYPSFGAFPVNLAVTNVGTNHSNAGANGMATFLITTMPGPSLSIDPAGTGKVALSWAIANTNTNAAILQMSTNLTSTNWVNVTNVPNLGPGYQFTVTNNMSGRAFFRLKVQ